MHSGPEKPLSEELVEHMAAGVEVYVGTRDANLAPESMLAMGIKAHGDRRTVTVFLPKALASATLKNLADNGQAALTVIRASTLKGVQLKGRCVGVRESTQADHELQAVQRAAMVEEFAAVGVPRSATRRLHWWPSVAVDVAIEAAFVQTPGPKAGEPLGKL
ncbi:MAG: pyridoxamine 5'-phosphate oxidase family protein [Myxococcota bacterium]